jgi:AraC-like DNA-binding protein
MALPDAATVYRSMGGRSVWERVGCGVMDKSGRRADHTDYLAPTWSVVWVLRGSGWYSDDHGRRLVAAGDCFQRWPGRRHTNGIDPGSGWRECFIDLGPALHASLAVMGVLRPEPAVWTPAEDPARLGRWLDLRRDLDTASEAELPRLCVAALGLAVDIVQPLAATADPIDRACALLAAAAHERVDLRSFCAAEGLAYEAFRKRFRRRTGLSPGQYRIRRRLERACQLLQSTDRPVAAIAADLGYASPFEFSAQFRSHLGVSPRAYRG